MCSRFITVLAFSTLLIVGCADPKLSEAPRNSQPKQPVPKQPVPTDHSALFLAVENGELEEVTKLAETGNLDLNRENKDGKTSLHLAAASGSVEIVELLIKKGAEVDSQAKISQDTPLMIAVSQKDQNIASALLEAGAEQGIKNAKEDTALDIAVAGNNLALVEMLLNQNKEIRGDLLVESYRKAKDMGGEAMDFLKLKTASTLKAELLAAEDRISDTPYTFDKQTDTVDVSKGKEAFEEYFDTVGRLLEQVAVAGEQTKSKLVEVIRLSNTMLAEQERQLQIFEELLEANESYASFLKEAQLNSDQALEGIADTVMIAHLSKGVTELLTESMSQTREVISKCEALVLIIDSR